MMNNRTKRVINTLGAAALIGLILVAPFALLELRYNTETSRQYSNFPTPLFGMLWFLATIFLIVVAPIVRTIRAGDSLVVHPVQLSFRLVFLALVVWMWGVIIIDQLPCFLGVPNCD